MKTRLTILAALCLTVFLAAVSPVSAEESSTGISVDGNIEARNQSGVHHGEVYRNYLKADLNFGKNFGNTVVKVTLRAEDDTIRPEDNDTDTQHLNEKDYLRSDETGPRRAYLREAYISHDIYFDSIIDSINLKMGRIIYTWGNSDEVKPVDIINPQDYSNLYFTLIQERKYGVFSGSMSIFFTENFFLEGVVIPEFRPSEIASNVFVQREIREASAAGSTINNPNEPDAENQENSYAGRLGLTLFDIDMHINYYYGYDHLPAYEMEVVTLFPAITTAITPVYRQVQMVGFDFQRALFLEFQSGEKGHTMSGVNILNTAMNLLVVIHFYLHHLSQLIFLQGAMVLSKKITLNTPWGLTTTILSLMTCTSTCSTISR